MPSSTARQHLIQNPWLKTNKQTQKTQVENVLIKIKVQETLCIMSDFSCCCDKSSLRKGLISERSLTVGCWSSRSHCVRVRKQKATNGSDWLDFSFLCSPQAKPREWCLPLHGGTSHHSEPILITPHRHVQRPLHDSGPHRVDNWDKASYTVLLSAVTSNNQYYKKP